MIRVFQKVAHVIQLICSTMYNHWIWFIRDIRYGMLCRNRDDLENRLLVGGHIIEKGISEIDSIYVRQIYGKVWFG